MRDMLASSIERILSDLSPPAVVGKAEAGTWPAALWQQIEESGIPLALDRQAARLVPTAAPLAGDSRCDLEWTRPEALLQATLTGAPSVLEIGATLRSAQLAGAIARVLDMSISYANDRKQFGQPISK